MNASVRPTRTALRATLLMGVVWLATTLTWLARALPRTIELGEFELTLPETIFSVVFGLAMLIAVAWIVWSWRRGTFARVLVGSLALLPLWQAIVYLAEQFDFEVLRVAAFQGGMMLAFAVGLAWTIWYAERRWQILQARSREVPVARKTRVWNPFNPSAWYLGGHSQKLSQSVLLFSGYSIVFSLLVLLSSQLGGCTEIAESPAGGGKEQTIAQTVKIQKVIRKKFMINPYSAIIFKPPPIEEVKLQLNEITAHQYKVGQGDGEGAGFSAGTGKGKVRFVRLEYSGGDWNQDFGIGADLNMLTEYTARTGQTTADETESRTIPQLANFPLGKGLPLVYITGQKNIAVSKSEVKILREYLFDKHGMLFADNGGSRHWHDQFFSLMRQVAPEIEPVKVPLDDVVHRVPYAIPFLPYVAPHGGRDAWGWKSDGRWICYYHPGDIGDAWSDGHSGVSSEISEACYQLGVNVIFYAYAEYNKWLEAQKKKD